MGQGVPLPWCNDKWKHDTGGGEVSTAQVALQGGSELVAVVQDCAEPESEDASECVRSL